MDVVIVDDDPKAREDLKECLDYYSKRYSYDFSVLEFEDGESFLVRYERGCDMVFLDIEMPGISGMEVARQLRRVDSQVVIVFVTNKAQYAINGYEVDALDYIVKPVDKYAFSMKMRRAVAHALQNREAMIPISSAGTTVMVKTSSVMYLEADRHYTVFHTTGGNHTEYVSIKNAAERFNNFQFVWLGRSFYVNMKYIDAVFGDSIVVGKDKLLVSRLQRKVFLEKFTDYISGGTKK